MRTAKPCRTRGGITPAGSDTALQLRSDAPIAAAMLKNLRQSGSTWAMPLILCALLMRMVIPAGWMPTVDSAGYTRITICADAGRQDAWIDASGDLHKSDPGTQKHSQQPCVFAGLGAALAMPILGALDLPLAVNATACLLICALVAIGRGLAAPPPPATGPPTLY